MLWLGRKTFSLLLKGIYWTKISSYKPKEKLPLGKMNAKRIIDWDRRYYLHVIRSKINGFGGFVLLTKPWTFVAMKRYSFSHSKQTPVLLKTFRRAKFSYVISKRINSIEKIHLKTFCAIRFFPLFILYLFFYDIHLRTVDCKFNGLKKL